MEDGQQEHAPPKKALVIDDDASIRSLLRTVLHRESFEVEEALNGLEAVVLGPPVASFERMLLVVRSELKCGT